MHYNPKKAVNFVFLFKKTKTLFLDLGEASHASQSTEAIIPVEIVNDAIYRFTCTLFIATCVYL